MTKRDPSAPRIINERPRLVPLDSVQPHPENPRQGDVGAIYESMKANGFYGFIVAQLSTGNILVGSHRWKAAKELMMPKVPVVYVDVDDDRARRIMLADNRTSDLADYDTAALAEMLAEIAKQGEGALSGTGWDGDALEALVQGMQTPNFAPVSEDEQGRLDQKKPITCPSCGHEWTT